MEYVRNRRLQLGRELLLGSTLAVGEIAARVGYVSQSAFTAALARPGAGAREQRRSGGRDQASCLHLPSSLRPDPAVAGRHLKSSRTVSP